ncbi:MAG: type IIL restriction-modification enzyme MmeI [Alloalcanivorax sp.]
MATFEKHVEKAEGKAGFIDLFWPGVLIAEHKSRGKDLDRAFTQDIEGGGIYGGTLV